MSSSTVDAPDAMTRPPISPKGSSDTMPARMPAASAISPTSTLPPTPPNSATYRPSIENISGRRWGGLIAPRATLSGDTAIEPANTASHSTATISHTQGM